MEYRYELIKIVVDNKGDLDSRAIAQTNAAKSELKRLGYTDKQIKRL